MALTAAALRAWVNAGAAVLDDDLQECIDEGTALIGQYLAQYGDKTRVVLDGVTIDGSTLLASETIAFTSNDEGKAVTGAGIPVDTTIAAVIDDSTAALSIAATSTGSAVLVTLAAALPPQAVIDRATKEVAADLWHRRKAPNGILNQQFAQGGSGDLGAVPIRISRDPLAPARPILDGWITPLGFGA